MNTLPRTFSLFILLFGLFISSYSLATTPITPAPDYEKKIKKALKSEKRVVIQAQKFIDAGKYKQANQLLAKAVVKYPTKDLIIALRGEALFQSKKINEAEKSFRQALLLNPQNEVANKYIEKIRQIQGNQEDKDLAEWKSIAKDKVGDFLILVIGIWLGTTLNSIGKSLSSWRFERRSKKLFIKGDYESFTDILEYQVIAFDQHAIRTSLDFMLRHKTMKECQEIFDEFVDHQSHLELLQRMISKQTEKASHV
jgi:tetratricopeptide (TPR) repeat protein